MPATVEAPLAVLFTLPGGVTYRRRLDDLPNQRLAAHLAAGLAAATHPHGPIRTRSVAMQYVQTARRMVRELHDAEFGGGLSELSPAVIVEYWLGCDFHRERRIRAILAAYAATGGVLDAGVGRHLQGRRINQIVKSRPNPPYSATEWRRLTAACTENCAPTPAIRPRTCGSTCRWPADTADTPTAGPGRGCLPGRAGCSWVRRRRRRTRPAARSAAR